VPCALCFSFHVTKLPEPANRLPELRPSKHDRYTQSKRSGIELLLIRLHVHATLELGAGSPYLEADFTVGDARMKLSEALHAGVLHGVLQASSKVREELLHRSKTINS